MFLKGRFHVAGLRISSVVPFLNRIFSSVDRNMLFVDALASGILKSTGFSDVSCARGSNGTMAFSGRSDNAAQSLRFAVVFETIPDFKRREFGYRVTLLAKFIPTATQAGQLEKSIESAISQTVVRLESLKRAVQSTLGGTSTSLVSGPQFVVHPPFGTDPSASVPPRDSSGPFCSPYDGYYPIASECGPEDERVCRLWWGFYAVADRYSSAEFVNNCGKKVPPPSKAFAAAQLEPKVSLDFS